MSLSLQPEESSIVGAWRTQGGKMEEDANSRRIHYLIENELEEISTSNDGWSKIYRDKRHGKYWKLSYLDGETHGGGAPRLDLID